ncbi:MAG: glycoside hydrolase family 78 protein, partial [Pirellulales bacterium]|nr:glycoside hydrolase family 78 protein [Pirellulales bacterium]
CGLGQYELRLNGDKVGDHVMDPGWTDYAKTCLYSTYNVTKQVRGGKNCLGVMLGNGMYHERGERYWKFIGSYGSPKMILCMQIDYEDGTTERIDSDDTWRVATGPITLSSIYGGEDYDARLQQPGWDRPGFDDKNWRKVTLVDGPGGRLVAQSAPPIKIIKIFGPKKVTEPKPGVFVYDLGQNLSGWPKVSVKGPAGASVKITPAEVLEKNGLADQKGSGTPCYFTYTLKGKGTETWHPQFTYYGFRYLQVEAAAPADQADGDKPIVLKIEGQFIRCSAARAGTFACSNPLMNRIYDLIDWSIGSNLQSVLTDCPHREKLGWLEVAHLMGPSIMYNYDVSGLYAKISHDTIDSQNPNGLVPTIAPQYVVFSKMFTESPAWGSAALIVPWQLYQWYGDRRVLKDCYGTMKRYVDYLGSRSQDHIVAHGLGDWYDFPSVKGHNGYAQLTPVSLVDTAMYYEDTRILADTAALLGKTEDARHYKELAETIRKAFNRALFNTKTGQYVAGMPIVPNEVRNKANERLCDPKTNRYTLASQTSQAIPLALGMVESGRVDDVFGHLVADVGRQEHLTAGDVGHRYVLLALAAGGRNDLVYKMHNRTNNPGYGWQLEQGLTSLGEAWDGRSVASMNHCMLGHLQEWFHAELLGIKCDPQTIAYKKIIIRPQVLGDLRWARGEYDSIRGKIAVDWRIEGKTLTLKVTIPANTSATVHVPTSDADKILESGRPAAEVEGIKLIGTTDGAAKYEVGSGCYVFRSPLSDFPPPGK